MKFIVALFSLVALVGARSLIQETHFRTDGEFMYRYEGQAVTGIPHSSEYYSGLKVKATVRLNFLTNGRNVALQLEDIELLMLYGKVHSPESLEQPEGLFQRISGAEEQEMMRYLSKPIVFSYEQGLVEELKVEGDDAHWSVNTKRGIINMFVVNLQERRLIEEDVPMHESTSKHSYFRAMEKGVLGDCEAVYEVLEGQWQQRRHSDEPTPTGSMLNVTKIYNVSNCVHRPVFQQDVFVSKACPRCHEEQPEMVQSGSQIRFNITGTRQQYMIESVIAESQYVFTPYKEHAGSIVTFINQTMYLVRAGDKTKTIEQPKQPVSKPIFMEIPELFEQYHWLFEQQTPKRDSRQVIPTSDILSLVQKIESHLRKPEMQIEVPTFIMRLVSVLRELYPEQLREVYSQSKSQLLFDVLPFVGTRPAVQLLLEFVDREERNFEWCAEALQAVAHYGYPTEKTIDMLIRIAEKSQHQQVRRTAWLTVGSLLYQLVQVPHFYEQKPLEESQWTKVQQRLSQLHEKYAELFTQQLTKSADENHKVLIIKAIANSGLPRTLPILKTFIYDKEQPLHVRVQAVIAFRRMTRVMPDEIFNVLLPIFKNQLVDPELRIACFEMLMACRPEMTTFQLFSQWLHREQNKQVGSYVFSALRTLANSTHPCYKRIAHEARVALRFGTPIRPGMLHSKDWHYSYMNEKLMLGGFVEVKTIGQKESLLPKWIIARMNTHVFGKSMNWFDFGVRAEGIQALIDRVFNKYSKPQSDLPIKPRHVSEPKVDLYMNLFGNEHRFWTVDRASVERMFEKQAPIKQLYEKLMQRPFAFTRTFMPIDGVLRMPTLFGLPLCVNVSSVAVFNVEGKLEEARFERSSKQLIIGGQIKPKIAMEIEGRMGIDAVLIKTGTAIKARINVHMPLNGKLSIDVVSKQAKFTTEKVEEPRLRLVEAEIRPFNFIEMPRRLVKEEPIEFVIRGTKINPVETRERVFGERSTGFEFTMKREFTPRNFTRFAPFHPLTGRQYFTLECRPAAQAPKQMEMTFQYTQKAFDGPVASVEVFSDEQRVFSSEEDERVQSKKTRYNLDSEEFDHMYSSESDESDESDDVYTTSKPAMRKQHAQLYPVRNPEMFHREKRAQTAPFVQESESDSSSSSSSESDSSSSSSESDSDSESWESAKLKMQPKKFYQQRFESKAMQHRFAFNFLTLGGSIRREMSSEFVWTYDQSFSEHQFQMAVERTPFRVSEKESWQMYFKGQMTIPRFTRKWSELPQELQGHGLFQFQWGRKSQPKKTVAITVNAQRSPDQVKTIQGVTGQKWYTNLKQQCQQDKQNHMEYSEACYEAMLFESSLNQFLVQIEYQREQLPRWFYHWTWATMRFAYGKLWRHAQIMDSVSNTPNMVRMAFTVTNDQRMMDVVFKTPRMNIVYNRLPLFTQIYPMVVRRPSMYYFLQRITGDTFKPFCKVMTNQVRTFDNFTFNLPEETQDCEFVLSKDCSEKQRYTVTMEQKRGDKKSIRVIADGVEIKMKWVAPQRVECTIDGKTYKLTPDQMEVFEKPLWQHKSFFARMEQTQSSFILRVNPTGITIYFDGENIMIEASNMYRFKQCGVCGDFNGEDSYEFVGPQQEIYTNEKAFVQSYILPNGKCTLPRTRQQGIKLPKY